MRWLLTAMWLAFMAAAGLNAIVCAHEGHAWWCIVGRICLAAVFLRFALREYDRAVAARLASLLRRRAEDHERTSRRYVLSGDMDLAVPAFARADECRRAADLAATPPAEQKGESE